MVFKYIEVKRANVVNSEVITIVKCVINVSPQKSVNVLYACIAAQTANVPQLISIFVKHVGSVWSAEIGVTVLAVKNVSL